MGLSQTATLMTKLLKLAWRNVWRNRRRSLITMGAILFAVVITTAMRSQQYGTYDVLEASAIRLITADLQVQRAGYHEEQTFSFALDEEEQDWSALLEGAEWLEAYARRVTGFGLVSSDSASAGAMILGIEPAAEPQVSLFARKASAGALLADGDDHLVVLGDVMARNLSVGVGDTVVVLTQGFRNEMGADVYAVKGLVKTGSMELDRGLMLMPLHNAQELFALPGRFTQVVLRTDNFRRADRYADDLARQLGSDDVDVLDWDQLMPELGQMVLLDNISGAIFLGFLILLLGFEIFNTTMMSVMERMHEFGVMQSIGLQPRQISYLVLVELMIKVILGLALGLLLAALMIYFLQDVVIPLPEELLTMYEDFGFSIDGIYFSGNWVVLEEPLVAVAIASLVAMVYPVIRVSRMMPVEALRA